MSEEKRYYANQAIAGFYVRVKDPETGKPVIQTNADGSKQMRQGQWVYMERNVKFAPVVTNPKLGIYCMLVTSDPDEIEIAEQRAADPSSPIMTEVAWKEERNPAAAAAEQRAQTAEATVDKLQRQLAELQAKIGTPTVAEPAVVEPAPEDQEQKRGPGRPRKEK